MSDYSRYSGGEDEVSKNQVGNEESTLNNSYEKKSCFKVNPYMDNEAIANLKIYQYHGGDVSISSQYFYMPVTKWLIDRTPVWIAPNTLTLIGFLFTFAPFVLIFGYYGTSMSPEASPIDNWVFGAMSTSYLTYRLLDEMDGKQARKTGNASPLGLLFDHGCDSLSVGFVIMIAAKFLQTGDGLMTFWLCVGSCILFHITTLEEYYLGGLFLQTGNGITDGSFGVMGIMYSLAYFGTKWCCQEAIKGGGYYLQWNNILMEFVYCMFICTVVTCMKNIICKEADNKRGKPVVFSTVFVQIFYYFVVVFSLLLLAFIGEKPIIKDKNTGNEISTLFFLIVLQNILMAHMTIHLQLCHVTERNYNPLEIQTSNLVLVASWLLVIIQVVYPNFYQNVLTLRMWIIILLIFTSICAAHQIVCNVWEISKALGIKVFKVKSIEKEEEKPLLV